MSSREKVRLTLGFVVGALAAVFAVLNTGNVHVNWIIGSGSTPLIIVIVVMFLIGMLADRILVVRKRRRARPAPGKRPQAPGGESSSSLQA